MALLLSCQPRLHSNHEASATREVHWLAVPSFFNHQPYHPPENLLPLRRRLVRAEPLTATSRLRNRQLCQGSIVLIQRGECSFVEKLKRGIECGAAAVIVCNTDSTSPHSLFAMHGTLFGARLAVPCAMVSMVCFEQLCALLHATPEGVALEATLDVLAPGDVAWLRPWEMGPALRAAVLMQDSVQLQALLQLELERSGQGSAMGAYNDRDADRGVTPVHVAVEQGAEACLDLLLQCGPDVDAPRGDDFRPLHIAAERGSPGMVRALLDAGAYVDVPHGLGWVALHFAAHAGSVEVAVQLLEAGATVDYPAADGSSPLLVAVLLGHLGVVEVLMTAGADPWRFNRRHVAPADVARARGDAGCLALLREYHRNGEEMAASLRNNAPSLPTSQSRPSSLSLAHLPSSPFDGPLPYWLMPGVDDAPPRSCRFSPLPCPSAPFSLFPLPPSDLPPCVAVLPTSLASPLPSLGVTSIQLYDPDAPLDDRPDSPIQPSENPPCPSPVPSPSSPSSSRRRLLSLLSQTATTCGTTPHLPTSLRRNLTLLELPPDMRRDLWWALLVPEKADAENHRQLASPSSDCPSQTSPTFDQEEEEEEEEEDQRLPTDELSSPSSPFPLPYAGDAYRTPRPPLPQATAPLDSPSRARCLYYDLDRTKFGRYREGEGMARLQALLLAWLQGDEAREYKQGLTSLAAPFLEVFGRGGESRALQCLCRVLDLHLPLVFSRHCSLDILSPRARALESLLLYWDPDLAITLQAHGIVTELFGVPWLLTLFADVLPMGPTLQLWDTLLCLGPSLLPCFALSFLLTLRHDILAASSQAEILVALAELNNEERDVDMDECLQRALHIYGRTPPALLHAWHAPPHPPDEGTTDLDSEPSVSPHVLEAPPTLSSPDLLDLLPDLRVLDLREPVSTLTRRRHSNPSEKPIQDVHKRPPIPGLPDSAVVVPMPFSSVRGHAQYCAHLTELQVQMKPPPPVRGLAGKFHISVYSDSHMQAAQVARLLALSHTPLVSVYTPDSITNSAKADLILLTSV